MKKTFKSQPVHIYGSDSSDYPADQLILLPKQNSLKDSTLSKKKRPVSSKPKKTSVSMVLNRNPKKYESSKSYLRSPTKSNQEQDSKIYYSSALGKQLHDDYNLKVQMNSLQKSINSQEKVLYKMQKKLFSEKSDLNKMQERFDLHEKKEKVREERANFSPTALYPRDDNLPQSPSRNVKKSSLRQKSNIQESLKENINSYKDSKKSTQRSSGSEELFSNRSLKDKVNRLLEDEIERKGDESAYQRRKVNDLKAHVNDLSRKYEKEIDNLKKEINHLSEENHKLLYKASAKGGYDEIEKVYAKRLRDLEQNITQKEKELTDKDRSHQQELDKVKSKLDDLNKENSKLSEYKDQIQELTEQLQAKNSEIEILKSHYNNKLQTKAEELTNNKKEWSKVHNELLVEIRNLKGELDLMNYQSEKISNHNKRETFGAKDVPPAFGTVKRATAGRF